MASTLQAKLMSVRELISDPQCSYEVPVYQRNFSWSSQEIEQLIDDVQAAAEDDLDDSYFLGNLIVAAKPASDDAERQTLAVIDGQQRLTTIHLLLRNPTIGPLLDDLGVAMESRLTYESRRASSDALERIETNHTEDGSGIGSGYRAIEARIAAMDAGSDGQAEKPSERFTRYLLDQVQVVRAVLPSHTDLNRYFEIMNTRGQQLAQVDIVKAKLMGHLRGPDVDDARACFAWVWDACAAMETYVQMSLAPGDTALRGRVFGERWDHLEATAFDDLVQVKFGSDPRIVGGESTLGSLRLREALVHYAKSPAPPAEEVTEESRFESPIKFPSLLLHTLKVMRAEESEDEDEGQLDDRNLIREFEAEIDRLTEGVDADKAQRRRSNWVKRFTETLLRCRFVLDNYVVKREYTASNSDDGAWSLKRLEPDEKTGKRATYLNTYGGGSEHSAGSDERDLNRDVLLLQSMLRITYTSPRTMHWLTALLRQPLPADTTPDARIEYGRSTRDVLRGYARRKVREAYFNGEPPTGFAIQRIVFTYLDFLLATGQYTGSEADPAFAFAYRTSIEHFFPQHPDREQEGSGDVDDQYKNLLGNLALISVRANSKFSNSPPSAKAGYQWIRRQSTKLELMSRLAKPPGRWDTETLLEHHVAMEELLRRDVGADTALAATPRLQQGHRARSGGQG